LDKISKKADKENMLRPRLRQTLLLSASLLSTLLLGTGGAPPHAAAQEESRFQPPPPLPPPQMDMDDMGYDEIEELESEANRPRIPTFGAPAVAPAPAMPNPPPEPSPPPPSFRGATTSFSKSATSDNVHFKVVEGEFYQKGKRRGRASDTTRKAPPNRNSN
jgi:hypothetical protein